MDALSKLPTETRGPLESLWHNASLDVLRRLIYILFNFWQSDSFNDFRVFRLYLCQILTTFLQGGPHYVDKLVHTYMGFLWFEVYWLPTTSWRCFSMFSKPRNTGWSFEIPSSKAKEFAHQMITKWIYVFHSRFSPLCPYKIDWQICVIL